MITRELIRYVVSEIQKGTTRENIHEDLVKKNLNEDQISHLFQTAETLLKESANLPEKEIVQHNASSGHEQYASPIRRTIAFIIDAVIVSIVSFYISAIIFNYYLSQDVNFKQSLFGIIFRGQSSSNLAINLLTPFIILGYIRLIIGNLFGLLYYFLPQWKANKTLGQKLLGLQIESKQQGSGDMHLWQAIVRISIPLLLTLLSIFPFTRYFSILVLAPAFIIDCAWYFVHPGKQTLHDYLSKTTVKLYA